MAIAAKLPLVVSFGLGLCTLPALAGSVADGTPAPPPQKGVNIASGPKAPATDEPVARLQMSSDLLAFGRDNKDPLALIVAARIMKTVGGTEADMKPEGRGAADNPQKPGQPVTPDTILVEARDLGKGDKLTNLLIDEAGAMGSGGGAAQLKTHQDTAQVGATDAYTVVYNGGQLAEAGHRRGWQQRSRSPRLRRERPPRLPQRQQQRPGILSVVAEVDRAVPHRDPEFGHGAKSLPRGDELTISRGRALR